MIILGGCVIIGLSILISARMLVATYLEVQFREERHEQNLLKSRNDNDLEIVKAQWGLAKAHEKEHEKKDEQLIFVDREALRQEQ